MDPKEVLSGRGAAHYGGGSLRLEPEPSILGRRPGQTIRGLGSPSEYNIRDV